MGVDLQAGSPAQSENASSLLIQINGVKAQRCLSFSTKNGGSVTSKFLALLFMTVVGITYCICFEAAAEKGVFTPAEIILKDQELAKETNRRKDELELQGFNFTWAVNIPAADGSPVQIRFPVVRQSDDNSVISLWFEATYGTRPVKAALSIIRSCESCDYS